MHYDCVILADAPDAFVDLCGISILERLLRTLQRCGVTTATIISSTPKLISEALARPSRARSQLDVRICRRSEELPTIEQILELWPSAAQFILLVRGDAVYDIRLLRLLVGSDSSATLVDSSVPQQFEPLVASAPDAKAGKLCGAALLEREWICQQRGALDESIRKGLEQGTMTSVDVAKQPRYDPTLRRDLRPFWFLAPSASNREFAERVLLDSVQKGSLDFPALIHAPIEKFVATRLCHTSITPHQLTITWIIIACGTTICFALGHLVWGIVLALIVGLIDGLDGKQARIKIETSESGKLEHRFDSLFEVAWPTALAYYFYSSGQLPGAFVYLALLLVAEALDGIGKAGVYSTSEKLMDRPGPFDRVVRLVGGRRNIYIWVVAVAVLLGASAKSLIVMAWWEALTAGVDLAQAGWSLRLLQRKNLPQSS
jgi:Phosphatidylglycerophosphate synthase